jgi:hypothetical protein
MELINETQWTPVELSFIAKSGMQPQYDGKYKLDDKVI